MAFIAEKTQVFYLAFDLTSYFNNFSPRDTNAITMFGDDNESYIAGVDTSQIDISGLFDGGTDAVDEELAMLFL